MDSTAPLIEAQGLTKSFPGVRALSGVDLKVYPGEIVAVVGENGAGKSTLMKILAGIQQPDDGQIYVDGEATSVDSVRTANRLGIALIHQELNLAENLDVAANIYLGREPQKRGFVLTKELRANADALLDRLGETFGSDTLVHRLSIGRKQMVEIAKALSMNARIVIMDEPSSSLSARETEKLFQVIRDLKASGVSIVYISHRLAEVKELADRVVVLRDGERVGELSREEITHERLVKMMVGRDVVHARNRDATPSAETVLDVQGFATDAFPGCPNDFQVRAGEIVGIAGLVGAGRTELLETLFGVRAKRSGTVTVRGKNLSGDSPRDAIRSGLALIPEDRKNAGLILPMTVRENLSLAVLRTFTRNGFLDLKRENAECRASISKLRIHTPGPEHTIQLLSGGNQQKVVIGKWLQSDPKVLLLDEPTRGIDVGAKEEVYSLLEDLAANGVGILFVSSELEEIVALADRVLVMHEGTITGELIGDAIEEERIMNLATQSHIETAVQ